MGELYTDKKIDAIKKDVSKEFGKLDEVWWKRDDLEITKAWIAVIDTYLQEIKSAKGENYGKRALEAFTNLKTAFGNEAKAMK
jgi:hypothetical protein